MEGVVLLHGIADAPFKMAKMASAVRNAGFTTLNLGYASRRKTLRSLADDIHADVSNFSNEIDGPVHFVTHSMGGLVLRAYLAQRRPQRLGRVVMLGPPNNGSEVADFLSDFALGRAFFGPAISEISTRNSAALHATLGAVDYPLGIIAGSRALNLVAAAFMLPRPNDGAVSVQSTKALGAAEHIIMPVTHTFMMRNAGVIDQTIAFLRTGAFQQ